MERLLLALTVLIVVACNERPIVEEDEKDPKPAGTGGEVRGDTPPATTTPTQERQQHTVMVVDNGFVLDHPVFQNKVVAKFTLRCTDHKLFDRDFPSYQSRKLDFMQNIQAYTNACQISDGLSETVGPGFGQIAGLREQWNQAIRTKSIGGNFPNYNQIDQVVSGQDIGSSYHGTNTASLIAFQNPNVKLVIVQKENIKSAGDLSDIVCPTPERMQQLLQLAQDPEVTQAIIQAGPSQEYRRFVEIYKQYNVTIANHSYGAPSNLGFQEINNRKGCVYNPDYSSLMRASYFQAQEINNSWRQQGLVEDLIVDVYAAGNDGAPMNQPGDAFDCHNLNQNQIYVGALNANGRLANFSNHGNCVSLYTLGEDVVVAAPQGFLQITSGTSFSAPLTVRQMTMNIAPNLSPAEMTQATMAMAPGGQIPLQSLPSELAYMVPNPINQFALAGPEKVSPPPQTGRVEPLPRSGFKK